MQNSEVRKDIYTYHENGGLRLNKEELIRRRAKEKEESKADTDEIFRSARGDWSDIMYQLRPAYVGANLLAAQAQMAREITLNQEAYARVDTTLSLSEMHPDRFQEDILLPDAVLFPALIRWALGAQACKMIPCT